MQVAHGRPALVDALVWTITLALLVWILWSVGHAAIRTRATPVLQSGAGEAFDRLDRLLEVIPRGVTVGYASPYDQADARFLARHGLARYVLTPIVLDAGDGHRFVIADFDTPAQLADYVRAAQGTVHLHADIGLALVERPLGALR